MLLRPDQRKLLFRATHRGTREMDIVVGGYAKEFLPKMDTGQETAFAQLLRIDDQSLSRALSAQTIEQARFDELCQEESLDAPELPAMLIRIWRWMRTDHYRDGAFS